jgi:hypothetical protein
MKKTSYKNVPNLLYRLKCEFKVKTTKEQGVGACSLAHGTLGVEGPARASGWEEQGVGHVP